MDEDCQASVRGCQHCKIFEGCGGEGSTMPHSGIHASRMGSCRLHQHRDNNGAESATKHQECLGPHRSFHKICNGICH